MIGYRIDVIEHCCLCDTSNVLVSKGLTTVTEYVDVKWNKHCAKFTDEYLSGSIPSPTQCASECRKQNSGFCPFFNVAGEGECWRQEPTGKTDCTREGDQLSVTTASLYSVQNIGNDI